MEKYYEVIIACSTEDLEHDVNIMIERNYVPHGSLIVREEHIEDDDSEHGFVMEGDEKKIITVYYQPMISRDVVYE